MKFTVRHRWLTFLAVGLPILMSLAGAGWLWIDRYLATAQQAIDNGDWKHAREAASAYLRINPYQPRARLLMAEALIRDDNLRGDAKVYEALEHLSRVPETSGLAADARLIEGRLYLLLLLQPCEAERCFQQSLQHDPDKFEAHSLLWRLYDLTNRWELSEEHVWHVCEQTPVNKRATPLCNWYLSEFGPGAANLELDRFFGFIKPGDQPTIETDRQRLESFIAADPQWPEGYAILARWYHRKRALHPALELLERGERLPRASNSAMLVALRVAISVEQGDFEQAKEALARWPGPHEGYDYWRTAGMVADQVLRDDKRACEAYEQAIATTPGKSDWPTQHRLAHCLRRLGENEKASRVLKQSQLVSNLMESELHARLRQALRNPYHSRTIAQMVELYQQLGRDREATAWQQLSTVSTSGTSSTADIEKAGPITKALNNEPSDSAVPSLKERPEIR